MTGQQAQAARQVVAGFGDQIVAQKPTASQSVPFPQCLRFPADIRRHRCPASMSRIGHGMENCTANLMQGQEAERVPSIGDGTGTGLVLVFATDDRARPRRRPPARPRAQGPPARAPDSGWRPMCGEPPCMPAVASAKAVHPVSALHTKNGDGKRVVSPRRERRTRGVLSNRSLFVPFVSFVVRFLGCGCQPALGQSVRPRPSARAWRKRAKLCRTKR